ncbi:MAG: putative bifunctional diguanylate cyclase/phosphodiesterase [Geminicoccaceae bacterium]
MPPQFDTSGAGGARIVKVTTWIAAFVALLIATVLPVTYYELRHSYFHGKLEADASNLAYRLSKLVSDYPLMWRFRADMLHEILGRFVEQEGKEQLQIRLYAGDELVVQRGVTDDRASPSWLLAQQSDPIYDSGRAIGRVELRVSLQPLLLKVFALGVLTTTLGLLAFVVLRQVPLRALSGALKEVTYLASHDPLTNLPNRTLFRDRLQQALAQAERRGDRVAVICLDLDHFKDVNDTLGHGVGDELLKEVTKRVQALVRASDTLARLGGDEFAIIQVELGQPDGAANLAQRIIDALVQPFEIQGHELVIGSSVGIALYPEDQADPDHLLRNADLALYRAKAEGRGIYRFFEEEMNRLLQQRKALEAALRRALADDQFELYYQPQVGLEDECVTGVEALIRWHHPEQGMVSPADFIPLAEETGIIIPITEWVLRRACLDTLDWGDMSVAVNLSPAVFKHQDLVGMVAKILDETGFDPRRLELEITETSLLQDTDRAMGILHEFKKLGVRVAMDDFGTGYSSLSYLQRFPFDKIKIDRSFVAKLTSDTDAVAIVGAVINLGHNLGMATTAEGVETNEQAIFLASQGCEEVQGFYYAEPMPAAEMASFAAMAGSEDSKTNRSQRRPDALRAI